MPRGAPLVDLVVRLRAALDAARSGTEGGWPDLTTFMDVTERGRLSHCSSWPCTIAALTKGLSAARVVVVGPTRGHAADLAALLAPLVANDDPETWPAFVFLGDYIDGGQQSMATLLLVLLLHLAAPHRVVLLRGRHEVFFPADVAWTGPFAGRLDEEIRLACIRHAAAQQRTSGACAGDDTGGEEGCELAEELELMRAAERGVVDLFAVLPLACVVLERFFCVCGGLGPGIEKMTLPELEAALGASMATAAELTACLVAGDPMDDDDDNNGADAYYISNDERGIGYTYSFNATCAFLTRNSLYCIIRGNAYATHRMAQSAINDCGRPWHYQHSPYDPGYRLYRRHPDTGQPAVVSLLSAPRFCGTNKNLAAVAELATAGGALSLRQFDAESQRPLQLPGAAAHAFAWAQPLLTLHLHSALTNMLHAPPSRDTTGNERAFTVHERAADMDGRLARYRRLCRLLAKRRGGLSLLSRKGKNDDGNGDEDCVDSVR